VSAGNLIAIIAAGVAMIAVVIGWVQANSGLKQNRELADLDAVRSVLDEAVVGLLDASTQIARIDALKETPERLQATWEAAEHATKRITAELERLKVRFGMGHPIVESFEGTVAACSEVTGAADRMIERKKIGMNTDSAEKASAKRNELDARRTQSLGVIEDESARFESERKRFIEAAHSLAGTKLRSSLAQIKL
jgi:hypothetical protein